MPTVKLAKNTKRNLDLAERSYFEEPTCGAWLWTGTGKTALLITQLGSVAERVDFGVLPCACSVLRRRH